MANMGSSVTYSGLNGLRPQTGGKSKKSMNTQKHPAVNCWCRVCGGEFVTQSAYQSHKKYGMCK